ncbi:MAG TPA: hypothetical protein VKP11_09010, partial [Frankiaceae bacterium]|nr:hypothetical protein [Frankiaceae bacterium]
MTDVPPPAGTPGDDEGRSPRSPSNGARDHPDLPPVDVTIPDDLSELADEVEALRRERRAAARRARRRRLVRFARRRPQRLPGPIVAITLIVVAAFVGVFAALTPRLGPTPAPVRRPLASPAERPGTIGGLLPDVAVAIGKVVRPVRDLRPALLVLLPQPCRCAASVQSIAGQAHETRPIDTYLVAPRAGDPELEPLVNDPQAGSQRVVGVVDGHGELAWVYRADPALPTLLLVDPGGRLVASPRPFHPDDRLESWLE